ncbi:outer membrane beta-barrel protein [Methylocystis bryophila]|uniref:Outer membrane protein beta-barrel domain-containing protein n=1 Tax=Methylocystis bryophila TaxID=655015 RepID=A0A1W6MWD7_9HYPH|nr:outer membrane beta-barrel protein [Methylocystis bryophila]ARN81897.1 hypothetical protein B1812_13290 [Methylocystis bryophila]BDV37981.1 hypothetical protein DSM21852_12340 [Methylocystis bryophila]
MPVASQPFAPLLRKSGLRPLLLASALVSAPLAQAADLALPAVKDAPVFNAPLPYELEVGARYFYSTGYYRGDLYSSETPAHMVSRLTYGNLDAHAAETFFRLDHETGLFLKGNLGGGSIVGGHMTDEDYAPLELPNLPLSVYSKTVSSQSGGSLQYATVDGGFNVLKTAQYRLGGFVGYQYFRERMNTLGCVQVAANPYVCTSNASPTSVDQLDDDARWQSLRLGLSGRVAILPGLNFDAEVAWAHNWLRSTDYHNAKAPTWGTRDDGAGNGLQAEALLSYDLTPQLSVGVGGRYWYFDAGSGQSHWERTLTGGAPAPQRATSERYGMFVQTAYKIGGPGAGALPFGPLTLTKSTPSLHDWSGFYLGPNIGYGMGATTAYFTPLSPDSILNNWALASVPTSRAYPSVGFVGGGQMGYNYAIGQNALVGVETDIDYAHIGGSFGYSYLYPIVTSAARTEWLGTTRLRLGWTPGSGALLLYATGGLAYGGGFFNASMIDGVHYVFGANRSASVGWVAGAGAELAVAENVSLRAEYLFVDLGRRNLVATEYGGPAAMGAPLAYGLQSQVQHNLVRLGVNYRFNLLNAAATPVLASY